MNAIQTKLDQAFRAAIKQVFNVDADPLLAPSQNEKFGDYQSNAAMSLAKTLPEKSNPRQVAEKIKAALKLDEIATEVTIAGPGFINVRLKPEFLASLLQQAGNDPRLSIPKVANPQTVVLDYSGPNIAKQMHVGHLRSTIIGDALSRVIEFEGHKVIRQNHIGDWGTQFGMLIAYMLSPTDSSSFGLQHHAHLEGGRYDASTKINIPDTEKLYREAKSVFDQSDAFKTKAREWVVLLQQGNPEAISLWHAIVDATRAEYQPIYERLNVNLRQENERGESAYNPDLSKVVEELKSKNIATESEGATVVFIDGPDKTPLIIQKSDGGYLYGTTDLAAIRYRINELHADRIIYTHDSRQAQHFWQVFETAKKASWTRGEQVKLEYAPFGTMLGEDGKPFKSRSGDLIKLKDLLDEAEARGYVIAKEKDAERVAKEREYGREAEPFLEPMLREIGTAVGIGAVKYSDLSKDRISDYVFSWDKMLALDGNTAPYLQYAYARVKSIFRKAGSDSVRYEFKLESPYELSLAKHILRLGETLEIVARDLKPHYLCTYLYDLATRFSSFYENCPVLQSEESIRASRLALCDLTARTMARGLDLLGIEHPEQM